MAKRRRSTSREIYNACMSKEIPKQRRLKMKHLGAQKLTRRQHNSAFTKAAHICSR